MLEKKIRLIIKEALNKKGLRGPKFLIDHPTDLSLGDYSINAALIYGKKINLTPLDLARELVLELKRKSLPEIDKVEIAGFGFINIYLKPDFFTKSLENINKQGENFGRNKIYSKDKVAIEYTDPNPFKEFHIGHMMTNMIGESLARLFEFSGAEVKRFCYSGDIGLHVAKAIYGLKKNLNKLAGQFIWGNSTSRSTFLGHCYALGNQDYDESVKAREQIIEINKEIYNKSNFFINRLYQLGRAWSLDDFYQIYESLDTKFDFFFFESETAPLGLELVKKYLKKGVFVESDSAIVFPGSNYNLHTRVFINSQGLPTYEAKDLALAHSKYEAYNYNRSLVITGNEINDYFYVIKEALSQISPQLAKSTEHLGHGMLRLASGKMSSRTGSIISFHNLLMEVEKIIDKKMRDRKISRLEKKEIKRIIALAALRFAILKQSIGKDIIFDFNKSISFEGDSGPYLLYSIRRAHSCLEEAQDQNLSVSYFRPQHYPITELERLLYRFPEEVERATLNLSPQLITTYLLNLAGSFNSFYANERIVDTNDPLSPYRLAITQAFAQIMTNGLYLLGIKIPSKM